MHFLDLESNMPSYEYTDNVKEISSVSLIEKYLLQLYLNTSITYKKTSPLPYKSYKNLDRLSDSEIIHYCQIYILQCNCSLVVVKIFRHWDVYHVRRITTFFYTAAASSSRARKTTLNNVKKGEISKTCIFMEIRE